MHPCMKLGNFCYQNCANTPTATTKQEERGAQAQRLQLAARVRVQKREDRHAKAASGRPAQLALLGPALLVDSRGGRRGILR